MRRTVLCVSVAILLLSRNIFAEPIYDAVIAGDLKAVEHHIAEGVDVNAKDDSGMTPLHIASGAGNEEVASLLISKGADVNAESKEGHGPLCIALTAGQKM